MLSHPLKNFENRSIKLNKAKFNGIYSRNNLPIIKDGTYVINLDGYKSLGTRWKSLHVNGDNGRASCNTTYFDRFGV